MMKILIFCICLVLGLDTALQENPDTEQKLKSFGANNGYTSQFLKACVENVPV